MKAKLKAQNAASILMSDKTPSLSPLYAPIARVAENRPDAIAIDDSLGLLSYGELDRTVVRYAGHLLKLGIRRGDLVGLYLPDDRRQLLACLALISIGAAHVMLNTASVDLDIKRYRQQFHMKLILVAHSIQGMLPHVAALDGFDVNANVDIESVASSFDGSKPWLLTRSSGSTGNPKDFYLTHAQTLFRYDRYRAGIPCTASDRFYSLVSLSFSSAKQRMLYTLIAGGTVILPAADTIGEHLESISGRNVSRAFATPFHISVMQAGNMALRRPNGLVCLEVGTAILDDARRRYIRENISGNLYVSYATTDFGPISVADPAVHPDHDDTVGFPLPGIDCEIVDGSGSPVGAGVRGAIRVRGEGVVANYIHDDGTAASPLVDGWFYPGDIGEWDSDGRLVFHHRADSMIICRGINISPVEVERTLLDHPAVLDALCIAVISKVDGQLPVALVVTKRTVDESELIAHCERRLDARGPRRILFVDRVPRTSAGKIVRSEVSKLLETARLAKARS